MKLITRAQWGARPARARPALAGSGATAHWEGPTMGSFPHASCATKVAGIQAFHMDARGWSDIAYNAVVCPHGYVFEGRGRGVRSAANGTDAGNDADFAVCYLSGVGDPFTAVGAFAMAEAMAWLSPGGRRHAHRDWKATDCPGDIIAAWAHSPSALNPNTPPTTNGGFGTMDDTAILDEFANGTTRTKAIVEAEVGKVRDELHEQAQRHNAAERARDEADAARDAATDARLGSLEAKLDEVLAALKPAGDG